MTKNPEASPDFSDADMNQIRKKKLTLDELFPYLDAPEGFVDRALAQKNALAKYEDDKEYKKLIQRMAAVRLAPNISAEDAYDICAAVNQFPPDADYVTSELVATWAAGELPKSFEATLKQFLAEHKPEFVTRFTTLRRERKDLKK